MNHMRAVSASRLAKASFLLAAIPLAAVLFLLFTLWRWGRFVLFIVNYASQNLAERSGTSQYLVKGVVIVVTTPFFWAVAKYMHGLWFWFRGVGPGLRLYRSAHGIMIVG